MLRTLSFKATKRRNTVGILTLLQILHKFSFLLMIVIRVLNGSLSTDCDITIGSRCTVIVLGEKCCTSELYHMHSLLLPIIQTLYLVNNINNTSIRVL